jgi:hypothetical protein
MEEVVMRYPLKLPALAGLLVLAAFASGPAAALPKNAFYNTYYFDAAHTQYAGFRSMGCSTASNGDGAITQYAVYELLQECTTPYDCEPENIGGQIVCLAG